MSRQQVARCTAADRKQASKLCAAHRERSRCLLGSGLQREREDRQPACRHNGLPPRADLGQATTAEVPSLNLAGCLILHAHMTVASVCSALHCWSEEGAT
jgi:hypothetical protein